MTRRDARVDSNQPLIVEAARKAGAYVILTFRQGFGCPDAFAFYQGKWYPLEIKDGKGTLTKAEQKVQLECPSPIHIIRSVQELYELWGVPWNP